MLITTATCVCSAYSVRGFVYLRVYVVREAGVLYVMRDLTVPMVLTPSRSQCDDLLKLVAFKHSTPYCFVKALLRFFRFSHSIAVSVPFCSCLNLSPVWYLFSLLY